LWDFSISQTLRSIPVDEFNLARKKMAFAHSMPRRRNHRLGCALSSVWVPGRDLRGAGKWVMRGARQLEM
jgi:hypothetical protein